MIEEQNEGGVAEEVAVEMEEPKEFSLLDSVDQFISGEGDITEMSADPEIDAEVVDVEPEDESKVEETEAEVETEAEEEAEAEVEAEAEAEVSDDLDALDPRSKTREEEPEAEAEAEAEVEEFPEADEIEALKNDDRAKAKWNELRSEMQKAKEEAASLKEAQENSALAQEYRQMQEQLAEAQRQLAAFDVEASEEYQQAVGRPLDTIMEAAKQIADRTDGIEADDLYTIMSLDGSPLQNQKMAEVAEYMDEMDKFTFFRMVGDSAQLLALDKQLRDNAAEVAVELEETRANQLQVTQRENQKKVREAIGPVYEQFSNHINSEDIDLGKLRDSALSEDLYSLDVESQAFALMSAELAVPLLKELKKSQAEITKLKKEAAALTGANPGVSPGEGFKSRKSGPDDGKSLFDTIDEELRKAGM